MVIILAGGGSKEKAELIDKYFSEIINKNRPLLYIPFARKEPFDGCLDWFKKTYEGYGITDIKMISDSNELRDLDLNKYSAIYVGGGNTYLLMSVLSEIDFKKKLSSYLKNGGVYYGGSAGAVILGKSVKTSTSKNEPDLGEDGLDQLGGKSIACHYREDEEKAIIHLSEEEDTEIIAIPEDSALVISKDEKKVVGYSPIYFIKGSSVTRMDP